MDEVLTTEVGERLVVLARLDDASSFEDLREAGVIRVALDGELFRLDEVSEDAWLAATLRSSVIDRIRVKRKESLVSESRLLALSRVVVV